jgi:Complex I intermediate-associated protein 30 (CIA30)/PHP domain
MQQENKKIKKKKHIIKRLLKYFFWLILVLIILDTLPALFYKPLQNTNPLQPVYKKGVYHVHSVFSDGKGSVDDITKAAKKENLDFVVLTDHGRPNIKCAQSTDWMNDVLLMGASELSLTSGHMTGIGFKTPNYIFPPEPQEAIDEIMGQNEYGSTFISHPYDNKIPWTDWGLHGFSGLEVLSSYTEARRAGVLKILIFPLKYIFNSRYSLLDTMSYPKANIDKWDELNKMANLRRQYYGIYALDAHAKLPITRTFSLGFPTYLSMFQVMKVYVKIEESYERVGVPPHEAANQVAAAIKAGRFFNVIEAIAPANGFDAYLLEAESGKRVEIGGATTSPSGKMVLLLPFHFESKIKVIKNGLFVEEIHNKNKQRLEIQINEPGVYRLEVFLPDSTFNELPWIMTNPFFVGMKPPALDDSRLKKEAYFQSNKKDFFSELKEGLAFKVEKNEGSSATIRKVPEEDGVTGFAFKLAKDASGVQDFWSVMALRSKMDLSGYKGIGLEVKSTKRLRYWLEFRTRNNNNEGRKDIWYRHSFVADKGWSLVRIPFDVFDPSHGSKKKPQLKDIYSIFIGINNQVAYENTSAELFFKNLSVY